MRTVSKIFFALCITLPYLIGCGKKEELFTKSYEYNSDGFIGVGNFNSDELVDIAVLEEGPQEYVFTLLNDGNGGFKEVGSYQFHTLSSLFIVYDFTGDGIDDIFLNEATFLLVSKAGELNPIDIDLAIDLFPVLPAIGNFNKDNNPDIAATVGLDGFSVLFGKGDGRFDAEIINQGNFILPIACGDLNNDGMDEIVATGGNRSGIWVISGNDSGKFSWTFYNFDKNTGPTGIVNVYNNDNYAGPASIDDFNNDGKKDIVTVRSRGSFSWVPGPIIIPFYSAGLSSKSTDEELGYISILLGKGDGTFAPAVSYPVGGSPGSLIIDDFNLDGIKDIAVLLHNNGISILLGKGDGDFELPKILGAGECPFKLVRGDFNGDGIKDLGVLNSCESKHYIQILLGDGGGGFRDVGSYDPGFYAHQIIAVDFNLDGLTDLVVAGKRVLEGGYYDSEGEYHPGVSEGQLSVLLANGR